MKKRLFSLLLALCLTVTMFAGMGTRAAAADDDKITGYLVSYTLKTGDTLIAVCDKLGIDFAANADLIQKVNGIVNFGYMMPGTQVWLPSKTHSASEPYYTLLQHTLVAGETPAALCQKYGIDYTSSYNLLAALNNNLTTFMAGQPFILPEYVVPGGGEEKEETDSGDRVKYYLAQHVLKQGETVLGICKEMGVDFATYDDMIRRLNNIVNYNFMFAGQTLLIPSPTKPSGAYYKIMEHTMVSGETVTGLCIKYGLDYGKLSNMILIINGRQDMSLLYPGEKILLPRPAGSSVQPTTTPEPGTTPAPTATPKPGTTPAPTAKPTPETGTDPTNPGKLDIPAADKVSYLLIPHVMQQGETVAGVCKKLNIDFDAYAARISQLNGITNYNYMFPGTLVLLPTTNFPASGPYYKIMAHVIVAGDTVYDLCTKYGLKYENNAAFLQRLNIRDNMQSYYVGETIYMPVYVAG